MECTTVIYENLLAVVFLDYTEYFSKVHCTLNVVHTGGGCVYDKHGSLDAVFLCYGPFYFGRRRMKNKL